MPHKFNNKTNGVTQRRWLANCNHGLRDLINEHIGEKWVYDLGDLEKLKPLAGDRTFQEKWMAVKRSNKVRLADAVWKECGVRVNPDAMFDVQVKRIHEYKRQLLNVLHVIHLYDRIKRGDMSDWTPRCVLIGGKAAPGYWRAKLIVKLISNVAGVINRDSEVNEHLQLLFMPNYRVSAMEIICPASDLSEQISTAGKEASGTGNMKFMMNGAMTIGTLDGANIEIREAVGEEHFFLFGHTAQEVSDMQDHYDPNAFIDGDEDFARVMAMLENGHFNQLEPGLFDELAQAIRDRHDPWKVAADFTSYIEAQRRAAAHYRSNGDWAFSSIMNTASSGRFSTDRTMKEYNRDIWKMEPIAPLVMDVD